MNDYSVMPINFRRLSDERVVVSNLANYFYVLDNFDEFKSVFIDGKGESHEDFKELNRKLFFSSERDYKLKSILTASAFTKSIQRDLKSPRLIMIVPTLRCDHHCSYCQVSRVNQKLDGYDLPYDSIEKLIEFILKVENPPFKIEFQGGESLLAFEYIVKFYNALISRVSSENFEIVITSSLSLLSNDIIEWCKGKKITFSTSIDAGRIAHNKHRKLITKDSYERVTDNIKKIGFMLGNDKVGTVTTVTKAGLESYDELVDAHIELGLNQLFVRPVSEYGFALGKQVEDVSISEFLDFYKKLVIRVLEENKSGNFIVESFLLIHYRRIVNAVGENYVDLMSPAGYLKNAIVIDYNGNVFGSDEARMVYRKNKDDSLVVGNILDSSKFDLNFSNFLLEKSFNYDVPGCSDCVYQGICGSDPVYHLQRFGEPVGDKSKSRFCQLHKGVFDLIFELIKKSDYKKVLDGWTNA